MGGVRGVEGRTTFLLLAPSLPPSKPRPHNRKLGGTERGGGVGSSGMCRVSCTQALLAASPPSDWLEGGTCFWVVSFLPLPASVTRSPCLTTPSNPPEGLPMVPSPILYCHTHTHTGGNCRGSEWRSSLLVTRPDGSFSLASAVSCYRLHHRRRDATTPTPTPVTHTHTPFHELADSICRFCAWSSAPNLHPSFPAGRVVLKTDAEGKFRGSG